MTSQCVCPDCGNAFKGIGGFNVHHRACHPDVYHAARQPVARVKARWSHEEMVLVAHTELGLCGTKPPGGILRVLQSRFPDRTLEAIKCLRNKNRRYMEVLAALEAEQQTPDQELPEADSSEHSSEPSGVECSWRDHLHMAINIAHLGVDDLDWVTDGCPDQAVRDRLDEVFTSWVGHLVRGERAASGSQRPVSDDAGPDRELDPQRRRRAQYSALQHLCGRKPSACAHRVLDGSWESTDQVRRPLWSSFERIPSLSLKLHLSRITDGRPALDR